MRSTGGSVRLKSIALRGLTGRRKLALGLVSTLLTFAASAAPAGAAGSLTCLVLRSCPTITGVSPTFGPSNSVTITGTNLANISTVLFGSTASPEVNYVPPSANGGVAALVAQVPEGQAGSTVPVSGLDGTIPVPSTASYTFPLGRMAVTGPSPYCVDDPEQTEPGEWNAGTTSDTGSGEYHTFVFPDANTDLEFGTTDPVFHVTTEFDDDSSTYPFNFGMPTFTHVCPDGTTNLGDGAEYSATLEACTVAVEVPAKAVTDGACTDWRGDPGLWVKLPTVSDQVKDSNQVSTLQDRTADLALPTSGAFALGFGLGLDNLAETLRVVGSVQETDSNLPPLSDGSPGQVDYRHATDDSAPFTAILSPIAVVQASAVPYTIIFAPPGDESTVSLTTTLGFGTNYSLGNSSGTSNSASQDQGIEDQLKLAVSGKDLSAALADVGFTLTDSTSWDHSTKESFGTTDDLTNEETDTAAFKMLRSVSGDFNDWPGNGKTCKTLSSPAPDGSLYDCSAGALQQLPRPTIYEHEAFWGDKFELLLHPQYAVFSVGSGQQTVMLGADPTLGERTVLELYDCAQGIESDGVNQCLVPYNGTGLSYSSGQGVSYSSNSQYAQLSPSDAAHLLALDPFYVAGSQNAPLKSTRAEPIGTLDYGAYAGAAQSGHTGDGEVAGNVASATYDNTDVKKTTNGSTTNESVNVTDTYGSKVGAGVTLAGSGETLTYSDKDSTGTTMSIGYKDSTAVSNTQETTAVVSLNDIDSSTPGGKCPAAGPAGPGCHGPLKDYSQANIYLDRLFGGLMFVDPNAPPRPALSIAKAKDLAALTTIEDFEGQAASKSSFTDVSRRTKIGIAAGTLAQLGLMTGFGKRFRPNSPFTHAELATSLGKALKLTERQALKLLTGTGSHPGRALTESVFAHALSRALGVKASVGRRYVAESLPRGVFKPSKVVDRGPGALTLLTALDARCLMGCHVGT